MRSLFRVGTTLRWDLLIQFSNRVFVETGTYRGAGILTALDCGFEEVHSIEIDPGLYEGAKELFAEDPRVNLYLGDSGKVLWEVIEKINAPITFWLDGHWEPGFVRGDKEVPIFEELNAIAQHPIKNHSILIDDANQIGLAPDPNWGAQGECWKDITIDSLVEALKAINPEYIIGWGHHPCPRGLKYAVLLAYIQRINFNEISWNMDFKNLL